MKILLRLLILLLHCFLGSTRVHFINVKNDNQKHIPISTFGFYQGGILDVQLRNLKLSPGNDSTLLGFSLDRSLDGGVFCSLEDPVTIWSSNEAECQNFILDLKLKKLRVICNEDAIVHIYKSRNELPGVMTALVKQQERKNVDQNEIFSCDDYDFDIAAETINGSTYYSTKFTISIENVKKEGLYNLNFHNCPNCNPDQQILVDFTIQVIETNLGSYLSAGEMPLPTLYFMIALVFAFSGMVWIFLLGQSKLPVFKIHYMMAVLVFLKVMSLALQGFNYQYIERIGVHLATWAIIFYVVNLLEQLLFFTILILLGSGWTFIKNDLATREKILIMIVIPLQLLTNIASIIIAESEEESKEHNVWNRIFIITDLLCCVCILFPAIWSMRHLKRVFLTDDAEANNLKKLKVFRYFYVILVVYIYVTRILVYLLKISVSFQNEWLGQMFIEITTYVFFVLTAYIFRPASHNPFFITYNEKS